MSYFLWPEARLEPRSLWSGRNSSVAAIEVDLAALYPGAHPVLFPSARAGLAATIEVLGLGRPDLVWLPPYSSHCVFDAVSRIATPTPSFAGGEVAAILVFHQWGYVHVCSFSGEIIEDSADSLCLPGGNLFPNGGRFALWSLPKVIGSAVGGVVFCRTEGDAERLQRIRHGRRSIGTMQFALRALLHSSAVAQLYWQGAEPANGGMPRIACSDIQRKLDGLDRVIQDRRAKLAMLADYMPGWLRLDASRLPSNVPVESSDEQEGAMRRLGVTSGFRRFNRRQSVAEQDLVRVLPIPIHQDVKQSVLESMIKVLAV